MQSTPTHASYVISLLKCRLSIRWGNPDVNGSITPFPIRFRPHLVGAVVSIGNIVSYIENAYLTIVFGICLPFEVSKRNRLLIHYPNEYKSNNNYSNYFHFIKGLK